jgi:hypothetical protein
MMQLARSRRRERSQRQGERDDTERGGKTPQATRVSERFPCQPASSSDRVKSCRERMSKHR